MAVGRLSIASSKVCMRHAVRVAIFMQVHPLLSCPSSWLTTLSVVCLSAGSESREVSKRPFGKVGADAGSRMLPLLSGIRAEKAAASLPGYSLRPLHPPPRPHPPVPRCALRAWHARAVKTCNRAFLSNVVIFQPVLCKQHSWHWRSHCIEEPDWCQPRSQLSRFLTF